MEKVCKTLPTEHEKNLANVMHVNLAEVMHTNLAGVTSSEVKYKKQQ